MALSFDLLGPRERDDAPSRVIELGTRRDAGEKKMNNNNKSKRNRERRSQGGCESAEDTSRYPPYGCNLFDEKKTPDRTELQRPLANLSRYCRRENTLARTIIHVGILRAHRVVLRSIDRTNRIVTIVVTADIISYRPSPNRHIRASS